MKRSRGRARGAATTLLPAAKALKKTGNNDDGRRLSLVRAAYEVIAREGFEGLRTRTVADRVGVNVATLHYYFPTKEALIGGLADYLCFQFQNVRGPAVPEGPSPALNRLHQEFADARYYRLERFDILTVMQELSLRAQRDPVTRSIIAPLTHHWRAGLEQMIENGIREGVFRLNLVPVVAAAFVASTIWGTLNVGVGIEAMDSVFDEIERWLVRSPGKKLKLRSCQRQSPGRGQARPYRTPRPRIR